MDLFLCSEPVFFSTWVFGEQLCEKRARLGKSILTSPTSPSLPTSSSSPEILSWAQHPFVLTRSWWIIQRLVTGQEDLEGGRNRFWHRKDMKPLCMQKTSFLQTAIKPTQANITLEQIHLLLLIDVELCMLGILQRLNLNMKFQFELDPVLLSFYMLAVVTLSSPHTSVCPPQSTCCPSSWWAWQSCSPPTATPRCCSSSPSGGPSAWRPCLWGQGPHQAWPGASKAWSGGSLLYQSSLWGI